MKSGNTHTMTPLTKQSGVTILELMVVIGVAGILAAWAVPNMRNVIVGNRLTAQTNELVTALQYARSEAAKRARSVVVTTQSGNTDWSGTWSVWVDQNNDGTKATDGTEPDIRVGGPLNTGFNNLSATGANGRITYLPNGSVSPATGNQKFLLATTDISGINERSVCLLVSGALITRSTTVADTNDDKCPWEP